MQKQDFGLTTLAEVNYEWEAGQSYTFEAEIKGTKITFSINGDSLMELEDDTWTHGMVGFALDEIGKCEFETLEVR